MTRRTGRPPNQPLNLHLLRFEIAQLFVKPEIISFLRVEELLLRVGDQALCQVKLQAGSTDYHLPVVNYLVKNHYYT